MTAVQVHVAVGTETVPAGALFVHRRGRTESATLSYASSYLARSDAWAVDPTLPLRSGSYQSRAGQALFGALTDCAPDRWGRTLLLRREARLAADEGRTARTLSELDHLLGVRDDLRQGALRFRDTDDGPFLAVAEQGVPALTDLPALLSLADRAERADTGLEDLQRLVRMGSSLGGARPKAHVRSATGALAIAKFPSADRDTWNVMAWEHVALELARACGLDVARSQLLDLAGRSVLVLDRFDRTPQGHRVGYVSAMTMLEATDGDSRSYLELASVIEERSDRASLELGELWRRTAFTMLVSNTDDHLRNHGFLHRHGDVWRLSPAFDLNPTPVAGPPVLSTALDDADRPASPQGLLAIAGLFRLEGAQARHELRRLAEVVATWPAVAQRCGLSGAERARMAPAFDQVEPAAAV